MTGASTIRGLVHVLVLSDDLERSRAFYEGVLGLEVGKRPPLPFRGHWLYADGDCCVHLADRAEYRAHAAELGLEVAARRGGPGPVDHLAFAATDYAAVRRRLGECGITAVEGPFRAHAPRQLFLDDPDGMRVEISVMTADG